MSSKKKGGVQEGQLLKMLERQRVRERGKETERERQREKRKGGGEEEEQKRREEERAEMGEKDEKIETAREGGKKRREGSN
jgi:hypothetical protein